MLELIVSQDGGVPFVSKSWDGKASDTQIFQERAEALITTLQRSSTPQYLVADANLYHEANAANLSKVGFITAFPTRVSRSHRRSPKRSRGTDGTSRCPTRYHRLELCHYGMAQRWLVVSSAAALERAEASVNKAQQRECVAIEKPTLSLASPTL